MNTGTAVAIGIGFLLLRGNSQPASPSGARPGSTAGKARNSTKGGGGFPSPFGAGSGRGGFNVGGDIIDTTDLFNNGSVIDFPTDVSATPDFADVGTGTDASQLNDIATLGVDNSAPQFDPTGGDSTSNDFGVAGDPGIDSGSGSFDGSSDGSSDFGSF